MGICASEENNYRMKRQTSSFSTVHSENTNLGEERFQNRNQKNFKTKSDSKILEEIFTKFDRDGDNYLNAA